MSSTKPIGSVNLYVGDLPKDLQNPEDTLFSIFSKVGMVVSIKACRDINTQRFLGYAYVNYQNPADASSALKQLNLTEIRPGHYIRVMFSQRDPAMRKSGTGNVFVKNLDTSYDIKAFNELFQSYGSILSCKLATNDEGKSLGYGFVHFEKLEDAEAAIEGMNGKEIAELPLQVTLFKKKSERAKEEENVFRNIYFLRLYIIPC